jgi:hypothetical protein
MANHSQKDRANSERLAEGECRAIELCQCGTLQLQPEGMHMWDVCTPERSAV